MRGMASKAHSMRLSGVLSDVQKHGQKTAYAFMVDADFAVNGTWRLRIAAQRMQQECQHRSIPYCAKAMQIRIYSGTTVFFTTRVFPSQAMGTEDGWQYFYPVHEVRTHLCKEGKRHLLCATFTLLECARVHWPRKIVKI